MANARDLLKRRKSASNTRKITRTMELVASAKLKKAQEAAEASRPYAEGLAELVQRLAGASGEASHPLMARRPVERVAVLICTSDRGLCGAFNGNLIRRATRLIKEHREAGRQVQVVSLGKKANSTLRFLGVATDAAHQGLMDSPQYTDAVAVITDYLQAFEAGELDQVDVVYSRFVSAAVQNPDTTTILPAGGERAADEEAAESETDFIYHPDPATLLEQLIPQTVKTAFFSTLLQTSAGEHAARRVAMKNATDAAGDLIKSLSRSYNRARQAKITQEIAEIVGAVEAMK